MNRLSLLTAFTLLTPALGLAQTTAVEISGTKLTIDFDDFRGAGFVEEPTSTQLDSDSYRVTGLSDGNASFGINDTSGDHARGENDGGVSTGGIYGFEVGTNDYALGWQGAGSDMTPGDITLRVRNNTGSTITSFVLSFDVLVYNDQGRSNNVTFNSSFVDESGYNNSETGVVVSGEAADTTPAWVRTSITNLALTEGSVADGEFVYLRWSTDDVSGGGSRDEFAIDNICLEVSTIPSFCGMLLGAKKVDLPIQGPDRLFVDAVVANWPVLIQRVPALQIPNDPRFQGLDLFFQVFMINALVFPKDPIKMSNGLKVTIGGDATPYGQHSGIVLSAPQKAEIGKPFKPAFRFQL